MYSNKEALIRYQLINSCLSGNISELKGKSHKDLKDSQNKAGQEESQTVVDFIDFERTPRVLGSEFLKPLIEAIKNEQVLEIYYRPFYEDKPNIVNIHPYLLKEFKYRWYLIGLSDNMKELRTYALDRFIEIKIIDRKFIPKAFNASEYFKNTVGVISPLGEPPIVKIEVIKPQAQYLVTQPLHESQFIDEEDDEKIVFAYHVHPTYELISLILGMGSEVRVLEPASLVDKIKKQLKEAISRYS
jgi:predicted DNA-binding transcriptional regulator YafY